ncbi:hypothetical protein 10S9_49 [uncultured Caudovirales phage]|uniref:Uncharacterized protein n=1 Tax=uncultured Caudovirales phage TaxID=2100421 RepID=A0A2H4J8I8_9CAUD|nr:hypothetical protein 10S9_49 [uncultured Caudovirales phage]
MDHKYLSYAGLKRFFYTKILKQINLKIDKTNGDISNTKVRSVDTISAEFPDPVAGESTKTFLGKVKKSLADWKAIKSTLLTLSMLTNQYENSTSKIPTSALLYTLKQTTDEINSNFVSKFDDAIALEQPNQLIRFGKDKGNIINVSLSIASPVTWAGNPFTIATLPTEYRPRKIEYMVCYANSGVALIQILTDGRIITYTQISNSLCYGSVVYLG